MPYTKTEITCSCCELSHVIALPLGTPEPSAHLCACCLKALGILHQNPELNWVKIARVDMPGGLQRFVQLRSDDEDFLEMLRLHNQSLNHGMVFETDQVRIGAPVDGESEISAQAKHPVAAGRAGFVVRQAHLANPTILQLFNEALSKQN